ncbi:MAG: hypothetical protein WAM85_02975 [Terracidiphilus sp.]
MRIETRTVEETQTTLQIINEPGTISCPGSFKLDVYFNLIEMQDFHDGVPGRKYSYGNLRFRDQLESSVVLLFLSKTRLVLTGGGIQTAVCLYGLNSFTVMGAIRKIQEGTQVVAA